MAAFETDLQVPWSSEKFRTRKSNSAGDICSQFRLVLFENRPLQVMYAAISPFTSSENFLVVSSLFILKVANAMQGPRYLLQ